MKSRTPATLQDRINHLEDLVVDLMQGNSDSPTARQLSTSRALDPSTQEVSQSGPATSAASSDNPGTPDEDGSPSPSESVNIHITRGGTSYVTDAHWAAVLDGIADIKSHFENEEKLEDHQPPNPAYHEPTGPLLLYGCSPLATREEILACLPPRPLVDQLVSFYFSAFDMSLGKATAVILHLGCEIADLDISCLA